MVSRKALVVGIDEYPGAPLFGCVNDAVAVAALLESNGDGSPNFDVRLDTNVCTKSQLLGHLDSLFCKGESELSLFYFAGHGASKSTGSIVTPDRSGFDYGVTMPEILALANRSKSKNKVIILDCCFSGKLGEIGSAESKDAYIGEGVTIMTASDRDETASEDGITGHGVFTELLIQGLKGEAADIGGNITPASLYSFIDQSLGPWEQRPLFKTNISRFLPIRQIDPKVPRSIMRKLSSYFKDPNQELLLNPSFEFTNNPRIEHKYIEPFAVEANVRIFRAC